MELFEKVLQEKFSFCLTHLKRKEIFYILSVLNFFQTYNRQTNHCTVGCILSKVTDLNQYLNQYLIVVEGSKKAVQLVCKCTEYAFRCSQNSATVQLVLLSHPLGRKPVRL